MTDDVLARAWADTQAHLPDGWTLDGLRCASTGLDVEKRSDDWIAAAVGSSGEQREARAQDPLGALAALAASFDRFDGAKAR